MRFLPLTIGSLALLHALPAQAEDVPVSNASELEAAIAAAAPGDVILLADGTYPITNITCGADGTEAEPIVVRSVNRLGAHVEISGLEGFIVNGAHWHFEGLDISGVCANHSNCEHAFHVVGAEGFVLRHSRVRDFNAQLKANATAGGAAIPHRGTVEYCEIADTATRNTGNPVSKLNINTGDDWVVRGNFIHDFHKGGGNNISYGAFMKSGGNRGLFERNLVVCSLDVNTGGARLGLSFGGGGTGNQFCAPAFDANVDCAVEHYEGTMRNNIVVSCSDVAVYLNQSRDTRLLHNTFIDTSGVDFRYENSDGQAVGNLLDGRIRDRDGSSHTATDNLTQQPLSFFEGLYADPLGLDFAIIGDGSSLETGAMLPDVADDYCARTRPGSNVAIGALEHSHGDCEVVPPPEGSTSGAGGGGAGTGGAGTGGSGSGTGGTGQGTGGTTSAGGSAQMLGADDEGCSCSMPGAPARRPSHLAFLAAALAFAVRTRRSRSVDQAAKR